MKNPSFRPPAVPLVVHDPYFSVWSTTDHLAEDSTKHWTGSNQAMSGLLRIDGQPYRFMGKEPRDVPTMEQVAVEVLPTTTRYTFEAGSVRLTLAFITPVLPDDLDTLARPVTYLAWEIHTLDGASHQVQIYFDVSAEICVDSPGQRVSFGRYHMGPFSVLRVGSQDQRILDRSGDDLRIEWGHFYLVQPAGVPGHTALADRWGRRAFCWNGTIPVTDDLRSPRAANDATPVLAFSMELEAAPAPFSGHLLLAYDDLYALEYFQRRLRPYWRRNGVEFQDMILEAERDYPALAHRCREFDSAVMSDLSRSGGECYALLAALAYRQCLAAHKLAADWDGTPVYLSKENFSNGCIGTVDVVYPCSPFFLLYQTDLLKAQLRPILDYAASPRWPWPFAPHDLGTYPLANGQVYGGGERNERDQMPVEECGNMLLMLAGLAQREENAAFSEPYWSILTTWAEYLLEKGMDPEHQLCTDDFAGHSAHNTNLSIKAILGLASYARLARMSGRVDIADRYHNEAKSMAARWMDMADDGDHYRLSFDQPGTWSQKYNLMWDSLLGLDVFPREVAAKEMAFYMTSMEKYGLPLDSRKTYTKLDWEFWTAAMAERKEDFEALVERAVLFADETPNRVPLSDWYDTTDARQCGFQARSVVGGVFLPLLRDEMHTDS